jgi:hypothetical protein
MNKTNLHFTISVQENTNKIISSSEEKFAGIRPGSLIKIDNDNILYTILNQESYFYIKPFTLSGPKTLIIDDDIGINLQIGDSIQISFKEYELILINDIINEGQAYEKDTTLNICGGELIMDISNGVSDPSLLKIVEIDEDGKIKKVGIKNKGRYLDPPSNPVKTSCDNGLNAEFNLKYNECDNRTILERNIININYQSNKSFITLDYSLPLNLKQGKLSCQKSFLIIDRNYLDKTKRNVPYNIYKDFTPNISIPTMSNNTLSFSTIFNKSAHIIDSKFKELEDRINILEVKK